MVISACMIVKDEEDNLPRCLDSIKDWVDEIIIVDTGSEDRTVEIAEEYGAKVYHQKWQNNFSLHRNYAMSKASGEWIFTIDADEEVPHGDGLAMKAMLEDGIPSNGISVNLVNVYGGAEKAVPRSILGQLRFFRRSAEPKYFRAVHNQPKLKHKTTVHRVPFRIIHYGYDPSPEVLIKKTQRMIDMCREDTVKSPDSAESWFNYARALKVRRTGEFNVDDSVEFFSALKKAMDLSRDDPLLSNIHIQSLYLMALGKYAMGHHQESAEYAEKALSFRPSYLDALYVAGLAYTYGIDAKKGEEYLLSYLDEQGKYDFNEAFQADGVSIDHINVRAQVYRALAEIEELKIRNKANTMAHGAPVN